MIYDFLIVGCGFFGSVFANEAKKAGKKVLVIEKRSHIGGNSFTERIENINVHKYGPHIFHTNDENIWNYINKFAKFNNFVNRPKVFYKDKFYSFPINLFTLHQLWGINNPSDAKKRLEKERLKIENPDNLEEWILSQVGQEIYEKFIKGYTQKQWGQDPKNLPSSIIKRLPIRLNFDDNYFLDKYQGIPEGGYTQIFEKLLEGVETILDVDFFKNIKYWESISKQIVFTGKIDELFNYEFGELEYRSLRFESQILEGDFQGNAVVNYTSEEIPFTRICEHKHFEFGQQEKTIITKEYPDFYSKEKTPYYPINNQKNNLIYSKYKELALSKKKYILGGRLAEYRYYDMHQVVASALHESKKYLH